MRFVVAVFAVLLPGVAAAQSTENQTIEEIRKNARMHFGPFYLSPAIQLKELGVDTNVFNQQGEQQSDFMFNISPKVNLWVPMARRALLTATAATDLVWFAEFESERSIDPQFTVRGDLFLHRLTFFAQNEYLNTRQRPNFEIDLRSRHLENTASGGVAYAFTPKFSLEAFGRRTIVDYDADTFLLGARLRDTLNRDTTGFGAVVRHKLTALTTVLLRAEQSREEFPFLPERNADSLRVTPGVEFKPRALIKGSAYVGFRRLTAEDNTLLPDFTGLVANLGLSYTLLGATTFGVSVNRDVQYSFERLQPYFLSTSLGGSVRRAIGQRFDALASIDRHRYAYRDLQPPAGVLPAEQRIDTTWNYAGSFGYRPARDARIGFGVSYWKRTSTTAILRNYDGLRVGTNVTYGF